jgi:hypothetical protein
MRAIPLPLVAALSHADQVRSLSLAFLQLLQLEIAMHLDIKGVSLH